MQLLAEKISRLHIGWNERPLAESDAHELCERFGVTLDERPLTVDGFYYRIFGRDFIAINSRLQGSEKLVVLFHELAHYLFHAPVSGPVAGFHHVGHRTRKEIEADIFALCAVIPTSWIESQTAGALLDLGFGREVLTARYEIYERHGV
jgi:Zn-dependent peptidase ImmA (M78 family)